MGGGGEGVIDRDWNNMEKQEIKHPRTHLPSGPRFTRRTLLGGVYPGGSLIAVVVWDAINREHA